MADLRGAELDGANLGRAQLTRANLVGIDLSKTSGVTEERLNSAIYDETTLLPPRLGTKSPEDEQAGTGRPD
jgi:uncharacterized protein YjbI with pentapeptide repeats